MYDIDQCKLIELPLLSDIRGSLSYIEGSNHIPFNIKRVYYLHSIPPKAERGGHAHKCLEQLIIPIYGSFDILLDSGGAKRIYRMEKAHIGLYVCPMMWRSIDNFSDGAVCMVLASENYEEADYYRNYDEFIAAAL